MRSIAALSAAAAALVTGLSGCASPADEPSQAGATQTSPTTTTPYAPIPRVTVVAQPPPEPVEIFCGPGPFGVAVSIVTTGGEAACPYALAVAETYAARSDGRGDVVITVAVGTGVWDCAGHDAETTPYRECVDKDHPRETIRLGA